MIEPACDCVGLVASEQEADLFGALRSAESIGRPPGNDRFLASIERQAGPSDAA